MGLNNFSFASANREGKSDNNIPGGGTLVGGSSLGCGSGIVEESIGPNPILDFLLVAIWPSKI